MKPLDSHNRLQENMRRCQSRYFKWTDGTRETRVNFRNSFVLLLICILAGAAKFEEVE